MYPNWICIIFPLLIMPGVPPTDALPFYEMLMNSGEILSHLHYAALALGDSNYPQFCKTGLSLDKRYSWSFTFLNSLRCFLVRWNLLMEICNGCRFGELSAMRMLPCQTVDTEDWMVISDWMNRLIPAIRATDLAVKADYLVVSSLGNNEGHSRINPFFSRLMVWK